MVAFILWIFQISVRYCCSHRLTSLTFGFLNGSDLLRGIGGVKVVEVVTDAGHLIQAVDGVNSVVHGDEADVVLRKYQFHHRVGLQMVSSESGLILDNDRSD